jgi:post-segregation antitoxin (ccd killing protein)
MGKRIITTIRIDEEDIKKAHVLGINISTVSRNAIKEAIQRMERKA